MMKYLILILSYFFSKLTIPLIEGFYINSGFLRHNYKGDLIPNSMGIIFIFNILFVSLGLLSFTPETNYIKILVFILGILTMGLTGLLDDFMGNNDAKGFRGHIRMLLNFKVTTGGIKAIIGGIVSILISLILSNNIANFFINIVIISLFTNFLNLLDLRPGRALKSFLVFSIPSLFFISGIFEMMLLSFIGVSVAYMPYDIKGRSMLGDIGSNCLGIILGIIATAFNMELKISLAVFLVLANLYSERHSFSTLISNNKILSFLDEFGRG